MVSHSGSLLYAKQFYTRLSLQAVRRSNRQLTSTPKPFKMMFTVGLGLARSRLPSFFKAGGVDGGYFTYVLHCVQPERKHSHALIIEVSRYR